MAARYKPCRKCLKAKDVPGWYCKACWNAIVEDGLRSRSLCGNCRSDYGCADCDRIMDERNRASALRGAATRRANNSGYSRPFHAESYWQRKAHAMVRAAIGRGLLPNLKSGEYACADCSEVACIYEHRDYSRPLDVTPVCATCNNRRGTAKWPVAGDYNFVKFKGK